jgi:DNA-binding response OmpR family regulator
MNAIAKNIVFNITIVEDNETDHSFLRQVIHSVVPQAIVESVYSDDEVVNYFNNCVNIPHLIFLNKDMLDSSGRDTVQLIKRVSGLDKVPIIFLASPRNESQKIDFIKQGACNFYSKPYQAQDLLNIVGSVNSKWLA